MERAMAEKIDRKEKKLIHAMFQAQILNFEWSE
jgi:hypothetical protein